MSIVLPLPLPMAAVKVALVLAFLLHIVFVNLMVGGTLVSLVTHFQARKDPALLKFVYQLVSSVTVHKSMAVVLGVGPLLLISLAYTTPFYTSSVLVAPAWLSVIWLVTLAFSLFYGYKFGWNGLRLRRPRLHAALGLGAAACFLVIPLIYLTNTQLMLDAAACARQVGFFEAMLTVGNVIPRYFHFMLASFAITGFWIALWWGRASHPLDEETRTVAVRIGTRWALGATLCQFLAGPLVLFTLPRGALTAPVIAVLALGIFAGAIALFTLADALRSSQEIQAGRGRIKRAAWLLSLTILCMGTSRHLIREALLARSANAHLSSAPAGAIVNVTIREDGRDGHGVDRSRTPDHAAGEQARRGAGAPG